MTESLTQRVMNEANKELAAIQEEIARLRAERNLINDQLKKLLVKEAEALKVLNVGKKRTRSLRQAMSEAGIPEAVEAEIVDEGD